jgi:hypothetical protein
MIDTLLGKISGLFEKDFLFASLLPALLFLPAVAATFAYAVGMEGIWAWMGAWTPLDKTVIIGVCSFAVVIFAYVLQALRPAFAHFWSGDSPVWLAGLGLVAEKWQRRQYRSRREKTSPSKAWKGLLSELEKQVLDALQTVKPLPKAKLEPENRWELTYAIKSLSDDPDLAKASVQKLIAAYKRYDQTELRDVYAQLKKTLTDRADTEETAWRSELVGLDRRFGSFATIRATELGNIIASYNEYASKRYKIETSVFWPRLRKVMTAEFGAIVQEPRVLLDFAVTMASLAAIYAALVLVVGPWIWFSYGYWLSAAGVAAVVAFFFYRVSVSAATQLGELIRASFDLFRLDLLKALGRPRPATFDEELRYWRELNDLTFYGDVSAFMIAPAPAPAEKPAQQP